MKVLHSAMIPNAHLETGVSNQMLAELNAAKKLSLQYDVKIFTNSDSFPKQFADLFHVQHIETTRFKNPLVSKSVFQYNLRKSYYSWLKSLENEYDCFVLRYSMLDIQQALFIKQCTKPVCLVHHTKETDELLVQGTKGLIKANIENILGRIAIQYSEMIIGVTNEIAEYEKNRAASPNKKSLVKPNGIEFNSDILVDRRKNDIPVFLFVASYFFTWHGLDLIIQEFRKSNEEFIIHLVGSISEVDLAKIGNDKRFVCHGSLSQQSIKELSQECWVGIGSFAAYRKNLIQGSSLKVREYLMMGLPVYSGHEDTFPNDFKFYKHGTLNIEEFLLFAQTSRNYDKNYIKASSEKYISKEILTKNFYNELTYKITD